MKVFAVPTITAGLTAAMSMLFFVGLSRCFGDALLGKIIVVQAGAGLVAMVCIPQCWVYLIGARSPAELRSRYAQGLSTELIGIAMGAVIVGLGVSLPVFAAPEWRSGALIIYVSLAIQASSSCLGWLRANESWRRYAFWNLAPNVVRVPLIWLTPWLVHQGVLPDASGDAPLVMALYFLAPDIVRLVLVYLPIAARNYAWPGFGQTLSGARSILQNWLFDIGSAATDTADKLVVGTLLGPHILVAYFFARKLGIITIMVTEPFYAEHFRRVVKLGAPAAWSQMVTRVYLQGIGFAAGLYAAMMCGVAIILSIPPLAAFVPRAISAAIWLFAAVLLVDCLLAANRWSRYLAMMNGAASRLLLVRLSLFALFLVNTAWFGNAFSGMGLAGAFALTWALEAGYVRAQTGRLRRPATVGTQAGELSAEPEWSSPS